MYRFQSDRKRRREAEIRTTKRFLRIARWRVFSDRRTHRIGKIHVSSAPERTREPYRGKVWWNGKDLADRKVATQARGDIGVVFQYPEHQLFAASVAEDVAFGPRNLGLTSDEVDMRVKEALAIVGLDYEQLADRSPLSWAVSNAVWRLRAF